MDLLSLKPHTILVELKHPGTGEPLGVTVECASMESDEVKAVERRIKNTALRSGRNSITAEKVDDNTLSILAAAIVGWEWAGDADLGGDSNPACSEANKRKLLAIPAFAKQIDTALGDEMAFFAQSASA